MKKIESMPGGRFIVTVFIIAFAVILLCGVIALFNTVEMGIVAIFFSLIPLAIAIFHAKTGYLSYIVLSELGIRNKEKSVIAWENVRLTLYISDPRIYYSRGQVDVLYIDDHYLTEDEIKSDKTKSFVVATPKTIQYLLSKCNSKIEFINAPCKKRHNAFIEYNAKFD